MKEALVYHWAEQPPALAPPIISELLPTFVAKNAAPARYWRATIALGTQVEHQVHLVIQHDEALITWTGRGIRQDQIIHIGGRRHEAIKRQIERGQIRNVPDLKPLNLAPKATPSAPRSRQIGRRATQERVTPAPTKRLPPPRPK